MVKRTTISKTRVAGEGADGNTYGVHRLAGKGHKGKSVTRHKPCPTCPWRKDAMIGHFPAEAYRVSANVAYDAAMNTFACHESGCEKSATCAGFLLANSAHNIGVRLAAGMGRLDLSKLGNPDKVPLYASYREMAIANGVDPEDPRIAACRADDEDGFTVRDRIMATGAFQPRTPEEHIKYLQDEDETDL